MDEGSVTSYTLRYVLLTALVVLTLLSCGPTRSRSIREWERYEWKLVQKDKEPSKAWAISRRQIRKTDFWEYKIEGKLAITPEKGARRFRGEIRSLAKGGNPRKYPRYDVLRESKDSLLTYVVHHEPFPFRDTEMCVAYVFQNSTDNHISLYWRDSWGDCNKGPNKKLKRVEVFRGSLHFSSKEGKKETKMVQTVQFNPKGMPLWLVNRMVIKFLKKELKKY